MKVLRTVIDKNGNEEQVFTPSSKMILHVTMRSEYPHESDADVCRRANIDPQLPGRWKTRYGHHYMEWYEEALDYQVDDDAKVLERVGMMKAVSGNYQFWKDMAKTKGVIKEAQPQVGIQINTDFSAILMGGDINEMRAQIMEKARGVLKPPPITIEAKPVEKPAPDYDKILAELEF